MVAQYRPGPPNDPTMKAPVMFAPTIEGIEHGLETFLQINAEMLTERHPVMHTSYNGSAVPEDGRTPFCPPDAVSTRTLSNNPQAAAGLRLPAWSAVFHREAVTAKEVLNAV